MRIGVAIFALVAVAGAANAQSFFEGFENGPSPIGVGPIPAIWTNVNNSTGGPGTNPNFQTRNDGLTFTQHSGTGYAFANYNAATGANDISLYMISPLLTLRNGDTINFWTRTVDSPFYPDRMAVEFNTDGTTSPASFTSTLLTINPTLTTTGYPNAWTQYNVVISGLGGPTAGRFAFHYNPSNGGPAGNNSDYIGIDDVQYTSVPAPASLALLGLGGLAMGRRRR